jgi:hypothetical protein
VDYFITSLRDDVRILKELPPEQKKKVELESLYSMPPISWSNMTYYYNTVGSSSVVVCSKGRDSCYMKIYINLFYIYMFVCLHTDSSSDKDVRSLAFAKN